MKNIRYYQIAAKSNPDDATQWQSFSMHSVDTANMIDRLLQHRTAKSVRKELAKALHFAYDSEGECDRLSDYCRLLALLHDIGKLTPAFQSKIAPNIEGYYAFLEENGLALPYLPNAGKSPHPLAGQAILETAGFPVGFLSVIGAHHGRPNSCRNQMDSYPSNYDGTGEQREQWERLRREWIAAALERTGFSSPQDVPNPDVKAQFLLTAMLITADWIASNQNYFPTVPFGHSVSETESAQRAESAWKKVALTDIWDASMNIYADKSSLFYQRFSFAPYPVQQLMLETTANTQAPGLMILEAAMGVGKTEAALGAAEILAGRFGFGGVYFGLPTQATANGIFGRIRDWAMRLSEQEQECFALRLAHGMTDLNEEYQQMFHGTAAQSADAADGGVIIHDWFEGRKQALLADFVVATVDQFLMASLKQRHVMLRHLGLAGKIVIIDECHAYDAYMNVYLDSTLRWMAAYRVPVILLSATLPPKRRAELVAAYLGKKPVIPTEYNTAYPLLTWTDGEEIHEASVDMKQAQKCIAVEQISESALPQVLGEKLSDGGCAAVIVNTVKFAQRLSEQLEQALPDCTVICFHSRFLATDRARIEQELLQRIGKNGTSQERSRVIVVGTQVLEQSLDLDFDYMVTELCPMDLLLQRSGRLHRHTRGRPAAVSKPVLAILQPDDEKMTSSSERIYGKWLLQQTERYLPDMLSIPSCIPVLVGEVYAGARTEEELADKAWVNYSSKMKEKRRKAQVFCIDAEDLDDPDECDTMLYFLDDETGDNEQKAIAAVRDTEETMEVLVMQEADAEGLRLIAGKRAGQIIPATQTPTEEEALDIARERLRLPSSFSKSYQFDRTVSELRKMPQQWAKSKWLAGEMLLVFDKEYCTELAGCRLNYDRKRGLIEEWNENST